MRKILFKAKRTDNGEWVEGYYVTDGILHYIITEIKSRSGIIYGHEAAVNIYIVDHSTICQYTGLTDKNNKKIWENDIVKCNYNYYKEKVTYTGKVVFRKNTCTFVVTDGKTTDYEWWNEEREVVDNIFDNPELLEED